MRMRTCLFTTSVAILVMAIISSSLNAQFEQRVFSTEEDVAGGIFVDCNTNGIPDSIDLESGTSSDCDVDGIPDECQMIDCNQNGILDRCDIGYGTSLDVDSDGVPDDCGKVYWITLSDDDCSPTGFDRLHRINPNGSNHQVLATVDRQTFELAVDYLAGKIYWAGNGKLVRSNLNGSLVETLLDSGITNIGPAEIALDLYSGKIYWTWMDWTTRTGKIQRANLDGSDIEDLVTNGLEVVSGIAIDPIMGKVYWSHETGHSIMRANLDGTNIEDVYITPLTGIRELALDLCAGHIYFQRNSKLNRINLDGSNFLQISSQFGSGFTLDMEHRFIFGVNVCSSVSKRNLDGTDIQSYPFAGTGTSRAIAVDPGTGDCNANGFLDCYETQTGFAADCNFNEIPDECEPNEDCNTNGVRDICDIGSGVSEDCNFDSIPDECQPVGDCNLNGTNDICEIASGESKDCNNNDRLDVCDLTDGTEQDMDGDGIPDSCCQATKQAQPDEFIVIAATGVRLNHHSPRSLHFSIEDTGSLRAIQITFKSLPPPFDTMNGQHMWVGNPQVISENSGRTTPDAEASFGTLNVAQLQCEPTCVDFGAYDLIIVKGEMIIPGALYDVRITNCDCDYMTLPNFSFPLATQTSGWGDVIGHCFLGPCTPPDGVVNVTTDVTGILNKFSNSDGAPSKSNVDISPGLPDNMINFTDVSFALDAFRGLRYPFGPPQPCK